MSLHLETRAIHAAAPDLSGSRPVSVPIYQTSTFAFTDPVACSEALADPGAGFAYSRYRNPTTSALEDAVADLEGGVGAIATSSGMGAINAVLLALLRPGDHVIAQRCLYGGTFSVFVGLAARYGIDVSYISGRDAAELTAALRPRSRLLYLETVANPTVAVSDQPALLAAARSAGLTCVVDNTFATPLLCRPIEHGAAIAMHSTTKYIGGHGTSIGGVIVDGGNFDWLASGRFPELTEEYEGFHGMNFAEESTVAPFALRARREGLRDFCACMSPATAFQNLQGVETLPLRMQRHVENTRKVVEFLVKHPAVQSVSYPELPEHPDYELAKRLLPRGCGAVFSFSIKGDRAAGQRFVESLKIFSHLANVGDAKSLVIHPASTTHFRMDDAALQAAGITEGTMRLSIGLEDADDLIEDLASGLRASQKAVK